MMTAADVARVMQREADVLHLQAEDACQPDEIDRAARGLVLGVIIGLGAWCLGVTAFMLWMVP